MKDLIKLYKPKRTSTAATALPTPMKTVPRGLLVLEINGLFFIDGTSIAGVVNVALVAEVVVRVGRPGSPPGFEVDIWGRLARFGAADF